MRRDVKLRQGHGKTGMGIRGYRQTGKQGGGMAWHRMQSARARQCHVYFFKQEIGR